MRVAQSDLFGPEKVRAESPEKPWTRALMGVVLPPTAAEARQYVMLGRMTPADAERCARWWKRDDVRDAGITP